MSNLKHLTYASVLAIHDQVLLAHGGGTGIRSEDLLQSAIAAPQATMMGAALISEPIEIAAAYLFYMCSNHPFVDGNNRTALATCLVFLCENGLLKNETLDVDKWENLTLSVAASLFSAHLAFSAIEHAAGSALRDPVRLMPARRRNRRPACHMAKCARNRSRRAEHQQ